ncbi:transient receptor potential cation channel subfamily V member 6-like isoform X1 [Haliotis rubra]|uniref:transient receptor potential cation channel subfamily V member 6-like isoform X1 n=1 Tax=Haliotis rubra TaxID=36100 RepID=UPI001EE5709F|nr:transient receptor potential cation channel subfamily V member 6-like isoform X1 [Haliotis rubra]
MSRKGRDFMLDFVLELMDKTVGEDDLIKSLSQNLGKNKEKTKNRDRLTSYRFNGREKTKHKRLQESDSGESLLHIAVSCQRNEVAKKIFECDPGLINCDRKDEDYRGQTPFHIAIAKANPYTGDGQDLVEAMIVSLKDKGMHHEAIERKVSGKKLRGTVMLGGTPLSIAALDNNETIVDLLLKNGADLNDSDSCGNTVFHSMVLYASFYPEKEPDILRMFDKLAQQNQRNNRQTVQRENARKQTALHLAAELGLDNVFSHILELKDAYKFFSSHDGVFDIYECDITELDKATWDRAVLQMSPDYRNTEHRAEGLSKGKQDTWIVSYCKNRRQNTNQSILENICGLKSTTAFAFLNNYTVQEVLFLKWKRYSLVYYLFLVLHLALMSILTWHLDLKVDAIMNPDTAQKQTLVGLSIFSIVISLLYIILEFHRSCISWQPFHLTKLHHNGVYRCIFVLFGFALLIDASWNVGTVTNNYCLVIALILGWWSTTFFLRGINPLSYITLMLQKVLFGDMVKFIPIIFIMIVGFTSALHSSFAETRPEMFGNFSVSLLTTFSLMTGQGQLEQLEESSQGSVLVFAVSVIVIQIFLLNILIAIMSTTCESVENSNKLLWLQRLSIVIFIEGILPKWLKPPMGREGKTDYGSTRYLLEIDRLRDEDSNYNKTFEQNGNANLTATLRKFLNQSKVGETTTRPDDGAPPVQYLVIDNYGTTK